jgi:hypothetical protein
MTKLQECIDIELKKIITDHFDKFDAESTEENFNEILQAWISPDSDSTNTILQAANMVFCVKSVVSFLRKIEKQQFREADQRIDEFFDIISAGQVGEILNVMLSIWLCPYPQDSFEKIEMTNYVDYTFQVTNLLFTLESELQKGGRYAK